MSKKYPSSVTATAPPTVANVGIGFDILGFALAGKGDVVTVRRATVDDDAGKVIISGRFAGNLPESRIHNSASVSADTLFRAAGTDPSLFVVQLEKNLPLGSGIGSSASSSAAAVVAANRLLGNPYSTTDLVAFAMAGEKAACGTPHADNVAPALLGGFVLVRSHNPPDIVRLVSPPVLSCAVVHPHIELKTSDARMVLRREIPVTDAIRQAANTAAFVAGLLGNDFGLISRSMDDIIAEPRRTLLIPGFAEARINALAEGAVGCGISGSGPSVFALCRGTEHAFRIAGIIQDTFLEAGLESDIIVSGLNEPGAFLLEEL